MKHADSRLRFAATFVAFLLFASPVFAHGYESGPIRIEHPWAAATLPGATTGAAYMKIVNTGATPIRLLTIATPAADKVEVHSMSMDGGIMKMRPVADLVIPANGEVRLKPGDMHLMLTGLKTPLVEEDFQPLKLTFEGGIAIELELYVEKKPDGGAHAH
jgi:copper(I)-binding protein